MKLIDVGYIISYELPNTFANFILASVSILNGAFIGCVGTVYGAFSAKFQIDFERLYDGKYIDIKTAVYTLNPGSKEAWRNILGHYIVQRYPR